MYQITQLFPTPESVINLGQLSHVPLIRAPSELADGYEPHDHVLLPGMDGAGMDDAVVSVEVYPGWLRQVGTREGLYRVLPTYPAEASFDAYLMNYRLKSVHTAV